MRDLSAARCLPLVSASTALRALPPAMRYVLRGGSDVAAAAERALGFGIPATACRATVAGDRAALWLGPDEWLLIAPQPPPYGFGAALTEALGTLPHSLVDLSHPPNPPT